MNDKYLQRYAEPEARALADVCLDVDWQHVVVVPAYREHARYAGELRNLAQSHPGLLVIVVLNQPDRDTDPDSNVALRKALTAFPLVATLAGCNARLLRCGESSDVLLVERPQPLPHREGVGLARKIGCDLAYALIRSGAITSPWIHSTDADATLPADYFEASAKAADAAAITFPFRHELPDEPVARQAMIVYEAKLRTYVDGLRKAGSPYAFQTLGSCLAIEATAYARVRGFPRRSGAEDFYILNKLAKVGPIVRAQCHPISLSARRSNRVPFGTGPALDELIDSGDPASAAVCYHPHCFECLRMLLQHIDSELDAPPALYSFRAALVEHPEALQAMIDLGLDAFLKHAAEHCADIASFRRQFHQWFDAFRTLKFIHAIRDQGWPNRAA